MNFNSLTQYKLSNDHGITGTLAKDPAFDRTKDGKEYAKCIIYCKAIDRGDIGNDQLSRPQSSDARELPLIAYVQIFDTALLNAVENLKKGYFVNFKYDNATISLSEDETTRLLRVNILFVANSLQVRYVPQQKPVEHNNTQSAHSADQRPQQRRYR
jgi:hypothetical protein